MKKRRLITALLLSFTSLTLAGVIAATFAWFEAMHLSTIKFTGETEAAYFAYGDGQPYEEDEDGNIIHQPYGIAVPRHLYNLAWLHYNGNFSNDKQVYFELADSVPATGLDMDGWTLPPIGTREHPFVGNFNGNDKIITNLTISNREVFSQKPSNIPYSTQSEIIGLFGVVGRLGDAYQGTYDSEVNTVYDLGITNMTVETYTNKALVGILAGYVDATVSNVAIDSSSIDINKVGNVDTSYVSDTFTTELSDYIAIGYCTDEYKSHVAKSTNSVFGVDVANKEFSVNDVGDGGVALGGTVNMTSMFNRLLSIHNAASSTSQVLRKTVLYDKEDANGNRAVLSSTNNATSGNSAFRTYHESDYGSGNFNYAYFSTNNTTPYMCMAGGHWENATYVDDYYEHTGHLIQTVVNGSTTYLGADSTPANNVSLVGKSDPASALVWKLPTGNSGTIYTEYNGSPLYIQVYNTTSLRLTTTAGNATTFTKSTRDGKTRFMNGDYYIGYSSGWEMIKLKTAATEYPNPPSNPGTWDEYSAAHGVTSDGDYQLRFTLNDQNKYVSFSGSTLTVSDVPCAKGWVFNSNHTSPTSSTDIYTTEATPKYISRNNSYALTFTTSNNNNKWKYETSDSKSYFYFTYTTTKSGTCGGSTTVHHACYLKHTDSRLTLSTAESESSEATAKSSAKTNETAFDLVASSTAVNEYNTNTLHNIWENEVKEWNEYQTFITVTEPANITASYNLTFTEISSENNNVVKGPDYYLDNSLTYSGMKFTSDDTTYFPLNVTEDGTQTQANFNKYYPRPSNTGYVVSGSTYSNTYASGTTDASDETKIRVSKYAISRIESSYKNKAFITSGSPATPKIYTVDSSYNVVKATNNLYANYTDNRDKLKNVLDQDTSYVYGLHFMDEQIDINKLVKAKYARLNTSSTPYTDYEMPVNSINFNLIQQGYINFFAGMYFNNPNNDSFMSLHRVKRDANNKIIAIKEIEAVYSDGKEETDGHSFVYKFTDGKYSQAYQYNQNGAKVGLDLGTYTDSLDETSLPTSYRDPTSPATPINCTYNLVFATERMTNHYYHTESGHSAGAIINSNLVYGKNVTAGNESVTVASSIFYFEIPMNDGEFCLGSVNGGTGGYLFYLDIGANAKKVNRTSFLEHFMSVEDTTYFPLGVAFIDMSGNTFSVTSGDGAFAAINVAYNDIVTIDRSGNNVVIEAGYDDDFIIGKHKKEGITFTSGAPPGGDSSESDSNEIEIESSEVITDIRRIEYYDFDSAKKETVHTIITNTVVTIDGDEDSNDTTRLQYVNGTLVYDSTSSDTNLNNPENATFYNDSGAKIAITTIGVPTAGQGTVTNTLVVTYSYYADDGTIESIEYEINAERTGSNTYYTADGFIITITMANSGDELDITTTIASSLPSQFTNVTVTVSGTYIITIAGGNISA